MTGPGAEGCSRKAKGRPRGTALLQVRFEARSDFGTAGRDVVPAPLLTGARGGFREAARTLHARAAAHATAGTGGRLAAPHLQRPGKHVTQSDHLLSLVR